MLLCWIPPWSSCIILFIATQEFPKNITCDCLILNCFKSSELWLTGLYGVTSPTVFLITQPQPLSLQARCWYVHAKGTHPEEEVRLDCDADFLGALLHLSRRERGRNGEGTEGEACEWKCSEYTKNFWLLKSAAVTLVFSTASSILSTIAASSTWRSQDALLMELTGWLFNHEVISATFSALLG